MSAPYDVPTLTEAYVNAYCAACHADNAWQASLVRTYGKRAVDMRYQMGAPAQYPAAVFALYEAWKRARDRHMRLARLSRGEAD